ncbi:hypothetical protein PV10_07152 [Exophiala mesophila]|uniref:Uncharacterized protein n=1 Tax=Exophiala mesophila TaxID=212818 RepID=A0A0D1Z776_EXOME|nr:uncharacterized protein PV10_07152 [Exophiala mesophila]KIV89774.1 hypothetical protein PV10_07152 [Exophiala mesophila]
MIHIKRSFVLLGSISIIIIILGYYKTATSLLTVRSLRTKVPQVIGLGDYFNNEEDQYGFERPTNPPLLPTPAHGGGQGGARPGGLFNHSNTNPLGPYITPGTPSPHHHHQQQNHTRNLIMARTLKENVTWLDQVDLGPSPPTRIIYVADDPTAEFHPPVNKGHEVMVYLTYILDFYDNLADVNIFMHSHRLAWHNDDLLNFDAGEMIKRLSTERVLREGYMNLRCHWKPGCPDWIHPGKIEPDKQKLEQSMIAEAWAEIFPGKPIPQVLAQPCCSQFALSRERIQRISKDEYEHYRNWMRKSPIRDTMSGRIFEYIWQVIFADTAINCPNQRTCYCDGFGVCFKDEAAFDKWFELRYQKRVHEQALKEWQQKADKIEQFRIVDDKSGGAKSGSGSRSMLDLSTWRWKPDVEIGDLDIPEPGKDAELRTLIRELDADLEYRRLNAIKAGTDPRVRAESAGRVWKEGDGF